LIFIDLVPSQLIVYLVEVPGYASPFEHFIGLTNTHLNFVFLVEMFLLLYVELGLQEVNQLSSNSV